MTTTDIVFIVIAVLLILGFAAAVAGIAMQRRALRERYGEEYQRTVEEKGGRAAAEAELRGRERRHAGLSLRELPESDRARFRERWSDIQRLFLDEPAAAVRDADQMVGEIAAELGYPVVDYHDRLAHLSVTYAYVLPRYRSGHDIAVRAEAGQAATEELRLALMDYRTLIGELTGGGPLVPDDVAPAGPVDVGTPDMGRPSGT